MRRPDLIEDREELARRLREDDEERVDEQHSRWEMEDRAGLGPWRMHVHRLARREGARRRALGDREGEAP